MMSSNPTITQRNANRTDDRDFDERLSFVKETMRSLLAEARNVAPDPFNIDPGKGVDFYDEVAQFETLLIGSALEITGGHQREAAKLLNLGNSTFCTKMKRLGIPHSRKTR